MWIESVVRKVRNLCCTTKGALRIQKFITTCGEVTIPIIKMLSFSSSRVNDVAFKWSSRIESEIRTKTPNSVDILFDDFTPIVQNQEK